MKHSLIMAILISFQIWYSNAACAEESSAVTCKVTLHPTSNNPLDRMALAAVAAKHSFIVCPFSDGDPAIILEPHCHSDLTNKIGQAEVENLDASKLSSGISECTPALSIVDHRSKPVTRVRSYLIYNSKEKFDPSIVRESDHKLDFEIRQLLVETGAPVVYYNSISNLSCMSFRISEKYSVLRLLKETDYSLPPGVTVSQAFSNCPDLVKRRFGYSMSFPANP